MDARPDVQEKNFPEKIPGPGKFSSGNFQEPRHDRKRSRFLPTGNHCGKKPAAAVKIPARMKIWQEAFFITPCHY
jgi:hypothetical protein